ncbi:MAG TPA: tRNA (adenosine(37)-N6)-threonylcarbamoyltransferase complex dimerization subunit type 1 TsaB [Candidatus Krumholzibacterium sp.]|nr:tRNA (adenosine(37)-N6)-threonylcarbamoyltransferase complex dimerization subunit type 1 TsaB [Candidatus Krumholzibacterium sp.]
MSAGTKDRITLALDTSRLKGSVAVVKGDDVLCEILFDASDTHSATLMPAIDSCMKTAGIDLEEVGLLAFADGPGSFTGLRIGLATIKALAAVREIPVAAVCSLEAMAAAFPWAPVAVMPVLDARRGEVYAGLYDVSGGLPVEMVPPGAIDPADAAGLTGQAAGEGLIVSGNGIDRYFEVLREALPAKARFAARKFWDPSASLLAMIAATREPVPFERLAGIEPLYIRPPDAKLPGGQRLREGG